MTDRTSLERRSTLALPFEKPVVIKPPELVAASDFLLVGWILLFLIMLPLLALGALIILIASLLVLAIPALTIIAMLTAWTAWIYSYSAYLGFLIDSMIAYFAISFSSSAYALLAIGIAVAAFVFLLLASVYLTTVRRTTTGNYEGARAASFFFGVLQILLVITVLPALFFLMAYGKMGEVIARYGPMAVLSDAAPIETMPHVPAGAAVPAFPVMPSPGMGLGGVAMSANPAGAAAMPSPPASPQYQHLGVAIPRVPLCPTCGRELYYASNYKRWYCLVCESRR